MGGLAEVLPASRLRKRMAREVDVGERSREDDHVDSRTRPRQADQRQTRPDRVLDSCACRLRTHPAALTWSRGG